MHHGVRSRTDARHETARTKKAHRKDASAQRCRNQRETAKHGAVSRTEMSFFDKCPPPRRAVMA